MDYHKDVGEVTVTASQEAVKAGVKEMVNKKQVGGVNSTFRVDKSTANVSADGMSTTPIAVVVTVADPEADLKKGAAPKTEPAQGVVSSKGVINNTPVEEATQPARLSATNKASPTVSAPTSARLTGGAAGRGLVARPAGPVAQPKSQHGPLATAPRNTGLTAKKDEAPRSDGPKADGGPKIDQKGPKQISLKEEVIVISGGLNLRHDRLMTIRNLGRAEDLAPVSPRDQLDGQQQLRSDAARHGPYKAAKPEFGANAPENGQKGPDLSNESAPGVIAGSLSHAARNAVPASRASAPKPGVTTQKALTTGANIPRPSPFGNN